MERRLAAVLAADMVGYSRLMATDESGTIQRQKDYRASLIDPKIAQFGGRIVKTTGDGMLVEFSSIVDAVQCAVEIQQAMPALEADVPEEQRIRYRVGINLGDIVFDEEDILGDGVNLAARLEGLAEPGGICVSGAVYDQVRGRLDLSFEDMGECKVKNIDRPLRVWHWAGEAKTGAGRPEPAAMDAAPLSVPDKPSIAVLAFTNMSGDPEQEYFSDGITEDIITELSRFRSLLVVARHSSFAFKGQNVDVKTIGRKLSVRFVVEGSVRRAGNRLRVTSQLVETASGNHVWAERYDRDIEDIFQIQDDLVRTIVSTVGGRIEAEDKSRASRLKDLSVPAYDLCLRAQALQDRNTNEAYREAEQHLRRAIEIDPHMAQAYHQLSLVKFWQWFVHWSESPEETYAEAFRLAQKALALDDTDGMVHAHLSMLHTYRHEFSEAGYRIEQALRLNPNDTKVLGLYGEYLIVIGQPRKAIELFETLSQLNPLQPAWTTRLKAIAYMTMGEYETAISLLKSLQSLTNLSRGWLTACLANAGRLEEAHEMLEEFLRVAEREMVAFPGRSLAAWKSAWRGVPSETQDLDRRFFDGMRKAGLQE